MLLLLLFVVVVVVVVVAVAHVARSGLSFCIAQPTPASGAGWHCIANAFTKVRMVHVLVRTYDRYVGTFYNSSEATSALATHLGVHRTELPQRQRVCRSGRTSKYQNVFAMKVGGFEVRIGGRYVGRYASEAVAATVVRNQWARS